VKVLKEFSFKKDDFDKHQSGCVVRDDFLNLTT
jgi:hypothetical protein